MTSPEQIIKLRGKTQKGKNRIRELGEEWVIVLLRNRVLFSNELNWMLIQPVLNPEKSRWIKQQNDNDFEEVK